VGTQKTVKEILESQGYTVDTIAKTIKTPKGKTFDYEGDYIIAGTSKSANVGWAGKANAPKSTVGMMRSIL